MRFYTFRGTRFASDPRQLAAPPFDQIDARLQAELHAAHPHQFAHLTRPESPENACRLLADWADAGVVVDDERPCLYAYEIALVDGRRRLGICGLVALEDTAKGGILPHESTVDKTIDERLGLLEETRTDLEPILMMCEASAEMEALLELAVGRGEPTGEHTDEFGHTHRLFPVVDPDECDRFRQILASSPGWIADGHHRYRTASEFARRNSPADGTAGAMKLAVVTSLGSSGLRIDPIHRSVSVSVDLEAAGDAIRSKSTFVGNGTELAAAVASAEQPAIGVYVGGQEPMILHVDPESAPEDWPESAKPLAAALLHTTLYDRFGLSSTASSDGTTTYRSDPEQLYREVESGQAATGFWLPPTSPELFAAAAVAGDRLPPKWTRFAPKLVSGLVWCSHDAEVV